MLHSLRRPVRFAAAAAVLAGLAVATPSSARETYPQALFDKAGTHCLLDCLTCHTSSQGGIESLRPSDASANLPEDPVKPERGEDSFFANMVHLNANGKYPTTDDAVVAAIKRMKTTPCNANTTLPCDSDGDGKSDYDELLAGRDPDVWEAPNAQGVCHEPKYGCGASSIGALPRESAATRHAAAVLGLAGVGLVIARRRRRR